MPSIYSTRRDFWQKCAGKSLAASRPGANSYLITAQHQFWNVKIYMLHNESVVFRPFATNKCQCSIFSQAWNRASDFATAYRIGKSESEAALNLLRNVDAGIGDALAGHVKSLALRNSLQNCIVGTC